MHATLEEIMLWKMGHVDLSVRYGYAGAASCLA